MWKHCREHLHHFVTVPETQAQRAFLSHRLRGRDAEWQIRAELDGDEANFLMSDGHKHRYLRAPQVRELPNGLLARVFDWVGRHFELGGVSFRLEQNR